VECSQPESSLHERFASEDELREQITGQWLECGDIRLWETLDPPNQVGIEFTPDGRWFTLLKDASGTVMRGSGFDNEGTFWVLLARGSVPGVYSVNMSRIGRGGQIALFPAFSDSPRKMRLHATNNWTATYVAAPSRRP
jgi:hypothetical protein